MKKRTFENPVIGDRATLIQSAEETKGVFTLLEVEVVPAGGNARHVHNAYSEKFSVLEGELEVQVKRKKHVLKAGDAVTVRELSIVSITAAICPVNSG